MLQLTPDEALSAQPRTPERLKQPQSYPQPHYHSAPGIIGRTSTHKMHFRRILLKFMGAALTQPLRVVVAQACLIL